MPEQSREALWKAGFVIVIVIVIGMIAFSAGLRFALVWLLLTIVFAVLGIVASSLAESRYEEGFVGISARLFSVVCYSAAGLLALAGLTAAASPFLPSSCSTSSEDLPENWRR